MNSYCIGTDKEFPDLAIEVVETSGSIDKLEVNKRLEVREVWFFKQNQFEIYHPHGESYERVAQSEMLSCCVFKLHNVGSFLELSEAGVAGGVNA